MAEELPILEMWRLQDGEYDEQQRLPLFLASLQIDSIPDLISFCAEIKPYVSMMATKVDDGE